MAEVQKKKVGIKKKATVVAKEKDDQKKAEAVGFQNLGIYLRTLPNAKKKFVKLRKRKKSPTSAELLLTDPRYSASKEGPLGLGPLVFPCLQRFNNIDGFMTLYVVAVLIHGSKMYKKVKLQAQNSSYGTRLYLETIARFKCPYSFNLEKVGALFALIDMTLNIYKAQLSLSKMESYFMDFSDYLASIIVAIFIAHFGSKGNRTKWVAASCILMGLGSMVFAFPFLKYEIIRPGRQKIELCVEENKKRNIGCGANQLPDKSKCIYFHIIGQCIQGIAGMPIYILGITFIFDHIPTSSTGFYLALGHSSHLMGYLLGVLGGLQNFKPPSNEKAIEMFVIIELSMWNDIRITGIKPTSSWRMTFWDMVGPDKLYQLMQSGWWKSFLFIAASSFGISLMMACFPTSLPGAHKLRLAKRKEPPTIDRRLKDKQIGPSMKDFLHAIWDILQNPLLLTQIFCRLSESCTFNVSLYFLPHHLQSQFLITPGIASLLTGLFVLPGGVIGHLLGGLIVDRLEMTNKNKLKFILVTSVVSVVLFLLIFFVECKATKFAGINEDYDG
ncbi:Solute carrier organic anion transporter family member 6C1 [Apodemus speciosus]|uniref:Solute carrier organic anion transporter family member 6C1 n=1 Tax=Apodemus speciosus TaxID=105296 RepID=A0ABQ0EDZ7_APOSI